MKKNGNMLDDYNPNNIITKYFQQKQAVQSEFVKERKTRKQYRDKHKSKIKSNLNKLFICPICNRVWKRYFRPDGLEKETIYFPVHPKRQNEKVCPECKIK